MNDFSKKKLPVFYHIPKCSGTYVRACQQLLLEDFLQNDESIEIVNVSHNQNPILEIISTKKQNNKTTKDISWEEFQNGDKIENLNIFTVSILNSGIKKQKQIIDLIKKRTQRYIKKYTIFRDPLEREVSLYNYIKSSLSNHDPYIKKIEADSIKEFLCSKKMSDSFIIRSLLNLKKTQEIEQEHYKKACEILNDFNIYDISETENAVKEIFGECYGLKEINIKDIQKNKSFGSKITISELDKKTKDTFLEKKYFDYKIYNNYIKNKPNTKNNKNIFADPITVEKEDCDFNHCLEFEDGEKNTGSWDMTHCMNEYLGCLDFKGKRVIDIGAGCGYPSFYMEQKGAEVVSHEIPDGSYWDQKIFPNYNKIRKSSTSRSINAYWYNHQKFNSKNKLFLHNTYEQLPEELGEFDIAVFAMVISHMRDPMLSLMNVLYKTRERVVIVNPFSDETKGPFAFYSKGPTDWWHPTFQCIREMLLSIGFKIEKVYNINPKYKGKEEEYRAIVFKRM